LININEINRLCGGDLQVAAQPNVQIDAEMAQKDHFRMETNSDGEAFQWGFKAAPSSADIRLKNVSKSPWVWQSVVEEHPP